MIIRNLVLSNFRNFASKRIEFDPKLTVIIGANGSGKSNILEAIGLLAATRLRSVDTDLDLVRFGAGEAKLESRVTSTELSASESLEGKKELTINFQVIDPSTSLRTVAGLRKSYFIDAIKKRWID